MSLLGHLSFRARRGVASMEFALCLPVVFLLFAAVVDGGRMMSARHVLARATRDAARVGSMVTEPPPATGDTIELAARNAAVRSMTAAGYDPSDFNVDADWIIDTNGVAWVNVRVIADFDPVFAGLSPFAGPVAHGFSMLSQEQ